MMSQWKATVPSGGSVKVGDNVDHRIRRERQRWLSRKVQVGLIRVGIVRERIGEVDGHRRVVHVVQAVNHLDGHRDPVVGRLAVSVVPSAFTPSLT